MAVHLKQKMKNTKVNKCSNNQHARVGPLAGRGSQGNAERKPASCYNFQVHF